MSLAFFRNRLQGRPEDEGLRDTHQKSLTETLPRGLDSPWAWYSFTLLESPNAAGCRWFTCSYTLFTPNPDKQLWDFRDRVGDQYTFHHLHYTCTEYYLTLVNSEPPTKALTPGRTEMTEKEASGIQFPIVSESQGKLVLLPAAGSHPVITRGHRPTPHLSWDLTAKSRVFSIPNHCVKIHLYQNLK